MKTVYITIGNSDDKLSQKDWALFWSKVNGAIGEYVAVVHGRWISSPTSMYQNACWGIDILEDCVAALKKDLREIGKAFKQESIAWAEAKARLLKC